jgi:hypothetical protein
VVDLKRVFRAFVEVVVCVLYVFVLGLWFLLPEPLKSVYRRMLMVIEDKVNHI